MPVSRRDSHRTDRLWQLRRRQYSHRSSRAVCKNGPAGSAGWEGRVSRCLRPGLSRSEGPVLPGKRCSGSYGSGFGGGGLYCIAAFRHFAVAPALFLGTEGNTEPSCMYIRIMQRCPA